MPRIDIRQDHTLNQEHARAMVTRIAEDLSRRINTRSTWQGDTLQFNRPGVTGSIEVHPDHIRFIASLGLALSPLTPMIQREVSRLLQETFAC